MITLANLSPQKGATKQRKRVGRGPGSGRGKTATRGHKGAKSRSGYGSRPGFEGGQMPLQRRLPKRGFTNNFGIDYTIISLSQLDQFDAGTEITVEALSAAGMCKKDALVKILANGEIATSLTVKVNKVSGSAQAKIESAGGSVVSV